MGKHSGKRDPSDTTPPSWDELNGVEKASVFDRNVSANQAASEAKEKAAYEKSILARAKRRKND
ncbi:MAG TPA: hypothetical protein VIY48_19240 [Candidatus Paceibacterota bacterium]